jgi:hypothetical protein
LEFALRGAFYIAVLCCGIYWSVLGAEPPRASLPLDVIAEAPVTGQTSRWDYGSVDGSKHQAYFPLMNLSGHSVLRITRPKP